MRTTKIGDRLKSYHVTEDGCRFHDRYWIGCNYCAADRSARRRLAYEQSVQDMIGASLETT